MVLHGPKITNLLTVDVILILRSGLKAPTEPSCGAELPSANLHSLFFTNSSSVEIFHKYFYSKSSHRLKSIIGTIIIIVNNNNFDFIAILLLAGCLKATA